MAGLMAGGIVAVARSRRRAATLPGGQDCDDELRDVFLAEARAALAGLERDMAQWRLAPEKPEGVLPLRRGFHTLKGSGLLVGATELGELSGKIEKVLMRVIERELAPRPDVIDLAARAVAVLPDLVAEFAGGRRSANASVSPILSAAERLLRLPGKPQLATSQLGRR